MNSYLSFQFFTTCSEKQIFELGSERVGTASKALSDWLNGALKPLLPLPDESIMYFPDEDWILEHVEFLSQLTVTDFFELLESLHGDRFSSDYQTSSNPKWSGFQIQLDSCSHLAFVYGLSSISERLTQPPNQDLKAILQVTPTGEKDKKSFLISEKRMSDLTQETYPYQWHPIRAWLDQRISTRPLNNKLNKVNVSPDWLRFANQCRNNSLQKASSKNLQRIGTSHFTDGKRVFHGSVTQLQEAIELKNCNLFQFEEIPDIEQMGHFARDEKSLWYWGKKIECRYPQSFQSLPELFGFYTDGESVYCQEEKVADVEFGKIRSVGHDQFLFQNQLFFRDQGQLRSGVVEASTYRVLNHRLSLDQNHVYILEDGNLKILKDFSPKTAQVIEYDECTYLFDAQSAAVFTSNFETEFKPLKTIDTEKLKAMNHYPFITDEQKILFRGKILKNFKFGRFKIPKVHPEFEPRYSNENSHYTYFIHDQKAYSIDGSKIEVISGANTAHFEILAADFARDDKNIFFKGIPVSGAQPSHFKWIDLPEGRWTDGIQSYVENQILPIDRSGCDFQKFKFSYNFERVNDQFFLDGFRIEGWNPKTHQIAFLDCIEDKDYFYRVGMTEGPHIIVWPKAFSDLALGYFVLDLNSKTWIIKEPLGENFVPKNNLILSDKEFEQILKLGGDDLKSYVDIKLENPAAEVSLFVNAQTLRIQSPIQLEVRFENGRLIERNRPVKTDTDQIIARQIFERLLIPRK